MWWWDRQMTISKDKRIWSSIPNEDIRFVTNGQKAITEGKTAQNEKL